MKLDTSTIEYIQNVVRACRLVNIDSVIIEPEMVRGMDDGRTVVIFMNENVPDMPFGSIAMSRLSVFQSRLDIIKGQSGFSVEAVVKDDTDYVQSIVMKATGTKIEYRCMKPDNIKAPKKLNDNMACGIKLDGDAAAMMQRAMGAMGADVVTLVSNSDGIFFEMSDVNKDVFKHEFSDTIDVLIDGSSTSFAYRYPVKTLLSLFKENPNGTIEVGERGLLKTTVGTVDVYVLPLA